MMFDDPEAAFADLGITLSKRCVEKIRISAAFLAAGTRHWA